VPSRIKGSNDLNSRVEQPAGPSSAGDVVKYVVAALLVIGGLVAFYWFEGRWPTPVRVVAVIAGVLAGLGVFMASTRGALTRNFLSESRFELRKVVWPSRQEATRMTWVVMVVVVVMSLMLAGIDLVIQWLVRLLLGH
jgi:preprotein translocase subunit SecE